MPFRIPAALLLAICAASASASPPGQSDAAGEAPLDGLWCGTGPLREFSLKLTQRSEDVEGELLRKGRSRTIEGRIEGNVLRTQGTKVGALVLEKQGDKLRVTGGEGLVALARGTAFQRADSQTCSG